MAAEVLNSSSVPRLNFCAKLNIFASISATTPIPETLPAILQTDMKYVISTLTIMVFLISCENAVKNENLELNGILRAVTSNTKPVDNKEILIKDSLKQLVIYVPSKDEIEQKIPPPPPGKTTSILRLLDFKKNYTENDSLKLLIQNAYPLKKIVLDKSLNPNIKVWNKNSKGKIFLSFSNPIYFEDNFAYIEVGFNEYAFTSGTAFLLKKENDVWKVIGRKPLWIT